RSPPSSTLFPYTTLFRSSRFEQLEPSLLFADFSSERAVELARGLPTLTNVVALGDAAVPSEVGVPAHSLAELAARSWDASGEAGDRKSTRLNSSHVAISY